MIGHPHEQELLAFQTHQLGESARRRLADHLADCTRCRRVIQLHREVRAAFAAPAPDAPSGLLDRILASRAAGYAVVLPTAEVDARRPGIAIPHRAGVAALALLSVVLASQVVPLTPLKQVWQQWSSAVADWRPFAGQSLHDLPYPTTPVARPAVLHPERLRPMTLYYQNREVRDGAPSGGNWYWTMSVSRVANGWQIEEITQRRNLRLVADSVTFGVQEWSRSTNHAGMRSTIAQQHYHFTLDADTITAETSWTGEPTPHSLIQYPASTVRFPIEARPGRPRIVGDAHTYLALGLADLELGWSGSLHLLSEYNPNWSSAQPVVSFLVRDEEAVTTMLGTFDAWVVSRPMPSFTRYTERLWIRKSDGVLLQYRVGTAKDYSDLVLTSITLP